MANAVSNALRFSTVEQRGQLVVDIYRLQSFSRGDPLNFDKGTRYLANLGAHMIGNERLVQSFHIYIGLMRITQKTRWRWQDAKFANLIQITDESKFCV
jgi:hypothetical protein